MYKQKLLENQERHEKEKAEKYSYETKDLYDRMTQRITPGVENLAGEGRAYDRVYNVNCHTQFSSNQQIYMLLPVWMLMSKYQDKEYLFAMNGQTGKIVGELPVCKKQARKQFWKTFFIWFMITGALAIFFGGGF